MSHGVSKISESSKRIGEEGGFENTTNLNIPQLLERSDPVPR